MTVFIPKDSSVLEHLGDGRFRRTLKDRTVYQFDINNRLVSMKDRHGNATRYAYSVFHFRTSRLYGNKAAHQNFVCTVVI
jgi:YD repeat-containing protein